MQRFSRTLVIALFLCSPGLLLGQGTSVEEQLILLTSSDAPGTITTKRLTACLQQLVHEWKLDRKNLPKLMFIHTSQKMATKVQINERIAVRKNGVPGRATEYFEVWIVGEPQLRGIVVALENVLESHYQMHISNEQRNTVMARVVRLQDATIDVQEGQ